MRAQKATRIRATHWALSIIITIMIYKKNYFSGNCVKLLFSSGEGGGVLAFLEGGEDMPTLWVCLLIKWLSLSK